MKSKFWLHPQRALTSFALQKLFFVPEMKADSCYLFLTGLSVFNINKTRHFHSSKSEKTAHDALEIR